MSSLLLNYVRAVKTLRLFHQTPVIVRFPVPSTHWKHNPWARNEVVTTRTCPIASHCLTTKCKIIVKFLFSYSIKHGWWQFIIAWFGIDTLNSFFFVLEFFARFPRIFLAANQLSNITGLVFSKRKSKLDRKNKSLCTKLRWVYSYYYLYYLRRFSSTFITVGLSIRPTYWVVFPSTGPRGWLTGTLALTGDRHTTEWPWTKNVILYCWVFFSF